MVSKKEKVIAVLKRKRSVVKYQGNLSGAIVEDDFETIARQILYVLWLNKRTEPQLQQTDVSRWRDVRVTLPKVGEQVIVVHNWGGGAVLVGSYVWKDSWRFDCIQYWIPMPAFG